MAALAQALAGRVDAILGLDFANDLAELFERISASLSALIIDTHFEQVQQVSKRFLFDSGFQEIGIRISDRASKVVVRHDTKDTKPSFPQINQVGDLDFFAQFFATTLDMNKQKMAVNELRGFMGAFFLLFIFRLLSEELTNLSSYIKAWLV